MSSEFEHHKDGIHFRQRCCGLCGIQVKKESTGKTVALFRCFINCSDETPVAVVIIALALYLYEFIRKGTKACIRAIVCLRVSPHLNADFSLPFDTPQKIMATRSAVMDLRLSNLL